jgi:hypothetical protein
MIIVDRAQSAARKTKTFYKKTKTLPAAGWARTKTKSQAPKAWLLCTMINKDKHYDQVFLQVVA